MSCELVGRIFRCCGVIEYLWDVFFSVVCIYRNYDNKPYLLLCVFNQIYQESGSKMSANCESFDIKSNICLATWAEGE